MRKLRVLFLSLLILCLGTISYAQPIGTLRPNATVNVFNASAISVTCSGVYAISTNSAYTITWSTAFAVSPNSIQIELQASNNNISFFTISTSTSTTGEGKTIGTGARFVRVCVTSTVVGSGSGMTVTVNMLPGGAGAASSILETAYEVSATAVRTYLVDSNGDEAVFSVSALTDAELRATPVAMNLTQVNSQAVVVNGCADDTKVKTVLVDDSVSGHSQIVALDGSKVITICGYEFSAAGAGDLTLEFGTGSNCGTGTSTRTILVANAAGWGDKNSNTGVPALEKSAAGAAMCINTSTSVRWAGSVTYIQQ